MITEIKKPMETRFKRLDDDLFLNVKTGIFDSFGEVTLDIMVYSDDYDEPEIEDIDSITDEFDYLLDEYLEPDYTIEDFVWEELRKSLRDEYIKQIKTLEDIFGNKSIEEIFEVFKPE